MGYKNDNKSDNKGDKKPYKKADNKSDNKGDKKPYKKADNTSDHKSDKKPHKKADYKSDSKNDKKSYKKAENKADIKVDEFDDNEVDKTALVEDGESLGLVIEGRNAVNEALKAGRSFDRLLVQEQISKEGPVKVIIAKAREKGIVVRFETKENMDRRSVGHHHQGVIGYVAAYDYVSLEDILAAAEAKNEKPFILILDGVEDPHNLGAIIRTANICGVHGVVIPKRRACGLTETVVKTSAGALEYTPVCKVTNITQTIEFLKDKGLWIAGADMKGTPMYDVDLKGAMALVIGGEGIGLTKLVSEKCDFIAEIPMKGDISSLNASVASGVLMYEAVRQRDFSK